MNLSRVAFCEVVKGLKKSNVEKALAVLCYSDRQQSGITKTSGYLTKVLTDHHVGTPNQTTLAEAIRKVN